MAIDNLEQLRRGGAPRGGNAVVIPTYQQRTSPSGQINVRAAQPVDTVTPALQGITQTLLSFEDYRTKQEEQRLNLEANRAYSENATNLTRWFQQRNQEMPAGGAGFSDGINAELDAHIKAATDGKPEYYKQKYESLFAGFRRSMVEQAGMAEIQESARHKLTTIESDVQAVSNRLAVDPSQKIFADEVARLTSLIDSDPALRIDVKEKVKAQVTKNLAFVMASEAVKRAATTQGAEDPTGKTYKGASVSLDSVSLANAIYGQESGSGAAKTDTPNYAGALGPMQITEVTWKTFQNRGVIPKDAEWSDAKANKEAGFAIVDYYHKKYNGDPEKVAAAYYGGEGAVNSDGTINRHWRDRKNDKAPTVGEYVDQVLKRAGATAGGAAQPKQGEAGLVDIGAMIGPAFGMLDYQQQVRIAEVYNRSIKEAQTASLANLAIESAGAAVNSVMPSNPDIVIDVGAAKAQAVAMAESRYGKLDAAQRLQVENYVEKAASDAERDRKRTAENTMADLMQKLNQNGGDYQALLRDHAPTLGTLPSQDRQRLNEHAGQVATGGTRATDWQAYNMLISDPETLKQTNLAAMADKFNPKELAQLQKLQNQLLTDTPNQDNIQSDMAIVKGLLNESGGYNDEKQAKFFSMLQSAIDQELAATGKKSLTQARKKEIANDLLVETVTSRGVLWDTEQPTFLIEVPAQERVKIEAALSEAGMPVNDYNVVRAYRRKLQKPSILENSPLVSQIPE